MAGVSRFEDLEAWQQARELTKRVYERSRALLFSKDFALRDQVRHCRGWRGLPPTTVWGSASTSTCPAMRRLRRLLPRGRNAEGTLR
jgi:hypothetical protein